MLILLYHLNVLAIGSLIVRRYRRLLLLVIVIDIRLLKLLLVSMPSSSPFVITSWSRLGPSILHFWLSFAQAQAIKSIKAHLFL